MVELGGNIARKPARHTSKSSAWLEVADPRLTEEQITTVQDEVFQVLGWE